MFLRNRITAAFVALLLATAGMIVSTSAASAIGAAPIAVQQLPFTWNGPTIGSFVKAECTNGRMTVRGEGLGSGSFGGGSKGAALTWRYLNNGGFNWSGDASKTHTFALRAKSWGVSEWQFDIENCTVVRAANMWASALFSILLAPARFTVQCTQKSDGGLSMEITGKNLGRGNLTINQLGMRMGGSHELDGAPFTLTTTAPRNATLQLTLQSMRLNGGRPSIYLVRNCELVKGRAFTENNPEDYSTVTIVCASAGNGQRAVEFAGESVGNGSFGYYSPNGSSGSGPVNPDRGGSFRMIGNYQDQSGVVANWLQAADWHGGQRSTFNVSVPTCAVAIG